ncbi:hypothetical protein Tco_0927184 [Tanacetum coccineum]
MERGLLSSGSKGNNKKDERKEKGMVLVDLAKQIKNIDGKVMGKDGKPLKMPIKNVKTSIQGLADDIANVIGVEGNIDDVSTTMGVNASDWIKLQPSNVLNVKPLKSILKNTNTAGVDPAGSVRATNHISLNSCGADVESFATEGHISKKDGVEMAALPDFEEYAVSTSVYTSYIILLVKYQEKHTFIQYSVPKKLDTPYPICLIRRI